MILDKVLGVQPLKPFNYVGDVVTLSAPADNPGTKVDYFLYFVHLSIIAKAVNAEAVSYNGEN